MELLEKYGVICLLLLLVGCKETIIIEEDKTNKIIHIAHTRGRADGFIEEAIRKVDFEAYSVLCLGGDIDGFTSESETTMQVWDELFSFGKASTLWTLGNHDIDNRALVEQYTQRPSFYNWNYKAINFLVLDDQLDRSNIIGEQLNLVETVADTIAAADYLIVLTHNLLWMYDHPILEPMIDSVSNGGVGNCSFCIKPNNFYPDIYPQLLKVKAKGIEVYCIAGDLGLKTKEFAFTTEEGIHFLASGIDFGQEGNKALILELTETPTGLVWYFEDLENL